MNNSPHLLKTIKGIHRKVILNILYDYIESLEKHRKERETQLKTKI